MGTKIDHIQISLFKVLDKFKKIKRIPKQPTAKNAYFLEHTLTSTIILFDRKVYSQ